MLDILRTYLISSTSAEVTDSIEQALKAFDRVELENFEQSYEELLMLNENMEAGTLVDQIVAMTKDFQNRILVDHLITVSDNASMDDLTDLIDAIMDIQEYDNPQVLLQTASLDGPLEEVFAEILSLVSAKTVEEFMVCLESVDRFTIERVKELATKEEVAVESEEQIALKQRHLDLAGQFCRFTGTGLYSVVEAMAGGLSVGYPFLIYANMLGRSLEAMPVEKAANELFLMALISSDGVNNPRSIIKNNIEQFISNIDTITAIDIRINELMLGFKP